MNYIRIAVAAVALALSAGIGAVFFGMRAAEVDGPREVAISCGESQRTIVRARPNVSAELSVDCVPLAVAPAAAFAEPRVIYVPSAVGSAGPSIVPAVYTPPAQPAPAVEARASAPQPRTRTVSSEVTKSVKRPSWQKRALIVGASAGTGAGVGALIGGKKGALIGAAAAGGGAAIVDLVKNR